jgi:hypothetical protein
MTAQTMTNGPCSLVNEILAALNALRGLPQLRTENDHVSIRILETSRHPGGMRLAAWSSTPMAGRLQGTAVFWHKVGPASFNYSADCDAGWKTVRGGG